VVLTENILPISMLASLIQDIHGGGGNESGQGDS
jgi:hypothetical protein